MSDNDELLDRELKSANNFYSENKGNAKLNDFGNKLKDAIESNNAATSEQKKIVAESLEENISNIVGELKKLLNDTKKAESEYKSKINQIEQREKANENKKIEIDSEKKQLEADKKRINDDKQSIASQKEDIVQRLVKLEEREIDAENGFSIKHDEMLQKFKNDKEKEIEAYEIKKKTIQNEIVELQQKQANLKQTVEMEQAEIFVELNSKKADIQRKEDEIKVKEEVIERAKSTLSRRREAIEQCFEQQKEDIRNEFIYELDQKENINNSLRAQLEKYKETQRDLQSEIESFKELKESIGGDDPQDLFHRIEVLQEKNRDLQKKIDQKPSDDLENLYKNLLEEKQSLETVLARKEQELSRESRMASQLRISAVAQETLEQEKLTLIKVNEVLKDRHKQLRKEVDDAMADQASKSPFPTLLSMDNGKYEDDRGAVDHRREIPTEDVPDLKNFVHDLRHRIAWDPKTKKELYYSEEDIRIFLAGLAMSKLHILQGISGTGKTSLPLAFARAIGGHCKTVSIQAGWRDKDDLIGHYNSFEKKFYERTCLEGIYEAQTPLYRNRPYVVLLDEMNLSRPEQYFAEFLSAMEQDREKQFIELMTESVKEAPSGFTNGRSLRIPQNLWFIGTANHDETTYEFADKTYDRSHVMELPRHEDPFEINKDYGNIVYSYQSIQKAFLKAKNDFGDRINTSLQVIYKSDLVKILRDDLDVSWGNRFERQALNFVSTMIASGGEESDAFDHLLSTKVFRSGKATGRYDTGKDDIENIRLEVDVLWDKLNFKREPVKSINLLDKELRRKGA